MFVRCVKDSYDKNAFLNPVSRYTCKTIDATDQKVTHYYFKSYSSIRKGYLTQTNL